ncbi:acyl-CoA dehydrogenase family protein [Pseudonocardia thermophila]|uniref:acyl-CoA dehydrogenase family protein n=1 Tax=Pseudonocardia thermophila TaxID=1848 RepID=UPI00248E5C69|nr:acyl-CoA dehydrogenase family protein [Pseudonocardia thermophila]
MSARCEFREDVQAWFQENAPRNWRSAVRGMSREQYEQWQRDWLHLLNTRGFAAPHVPQEWGGGGFTLDDQVVIYEEWARADAPPLGLYLISLLHVPGTLLAAGTEEQKKRYLRDAIEGTVWCQGFSEPGSGSDLASLRTRAVRDGDDWVVTGQKIWSSHAQSAEYCILLARTDPASRGSAGISYFILDMRSPGVDVRPIRQNTGHQEFCEIFLDDVRIPAGNMIGPEGEGWKVAQSTLQTERGPIAVENIERIAAGLDRLRGELSRAGATVADGTLARLVELTARVTAVRSLAKDVVAALAAGRSSAGNRTSLLKIAYTELLQDVSRLGTEILGEDGLVDPQQPYRLGMISGDWMIDWLGSWGSTIAAGTNEIQRNLVAERLLGLPREPRVGQPARG